MLNLLMSRRNRVSNLGAISRAISETALVITSVAAEFRNPAPAPAELAPLGLYEADETPPAEDIAAARKILVRLGAGQYGPWLIERAPSNRQTADLQEIAKIFKANGLGPEPMKSSAPSLKVKQLPDLVVPVEFEALAAVAL